jgi:hypothetical protein
MQHGRPCFLLWTRCASATSTRPSSVLLHGGGTVAAADLRAFAEDVLPALLQELCTTDPMINLETKQSLAKQLADVIEFVLSFDELKVGGSLFRRHAFLTHCVYVVVCDCDGVCACAMW